MFYPFSDELSSSLSYCGAVCRIRLCVHLCLELVEADWLSYSLCDKFNLYSGDRSLCPLCLEWFVPLTAPRLYLVNTFYPPNLREPRIFYFVIISVIRSVLAGKNIPTLAQL
uniref:Uncharacterized protein n=1 Tax=Microcystis aeruginosa (strain PCC 7806) TaxID=267872 RepID=A8YM14_MICA7|nr:unnamed protein product [Microcystis aeruginosa PCC 7806]